MSIQKRPDGKYRARYRGPDGRERARHFRTRGEAKSWLASQQVAIDRGGWIDPKSGRAVTVRAFGEAWMAQQTAWRTATRKRNQRTLRNNVFPAVGEVPLAALRTSQLSALVADWARSTVEPSTIALRFSSVQAMLHAAIADGVIAINPAARVKLPKVPEKLVQPLEDAEVDGLRAALPARFAVAVDLGVGAGLRAGELVGLTHDRVRWLRRELVVDRQLDRHGAGLVDVKSKARVVPVPPELVDELAAHVSAFGVGGDGRLLAVTSSCLGKAFTAAARATGIDATLHDLRHTYASRLIQAGCSVVAVAAALGDTKQVVLDTYAHLFADDHDRIRAAAATGLRRERGLDADRRARDQRFPH